MGIEHLQLITIGHILDKEVFVWFEIDLIQTVQHTRIFHLHLCLAEGVFLNHATCNPQIHRHYLVRVEIISPISRQEFANVKSLDNLISRTYNILILADSDSLDIINGNFGRLPVSVFIEDSCDIPPAIDTFQLLRFEDISIRFLFRSS